MSKNSWPGKHERQVRGVVSEPQLEWLVSAEERAFNFIQCDDPHTSRLRICAEVLRGARPPRRGPDVNYSSSSFTGRLAWARMLSALTVGLCRSGPSPSDNSPCLESWKLAAC